MFYKKLIINGVEYPIAVALSGSGAPTATVNADVGMQYMDEDTGNIYQKTSSGWALRIDVSNLGARLKNLEDSIHPIFQIANDKLQVSYDNGKTWSDLGVVQGVNATSARIGEVTLIASAWTECEWSDNLYSQVVTIDGVTANTQVDLTPSIEKLAEFYEKDLAFVTENDNGVVTVYCIGQKPENNHTIQVTMTEVSV